MEHHEDTVMQGCSESVFAAQQALSAALRRVAEEHGITAYDVIAILDVLKHRTIQFIYEDSEGE